MNNLYAIVWLAWVIALLYLYHKVFTVYYFSLGNGLLKELISAGIIGIFMTALTLYLWWVTDIIVILFGIANMSKTGSKSHIIAAIIVSIVIAVLGIAVR